MSRLIPFSELSTSASRLTQIKTIVTILAIFLFPIGFLSIRHSVHISLFLIVLLALIDRIKLGQEQTLKPTKPPVIWTVICLFSLITATALTQTIRQDLYLPAFDGPSKFLLAGIALLYLVRQPIQFIKIIEIAMPLGLIYLLSVLIIHPETSAFWGGRLATKFVDPNSMGSQSLILASLTLFSIRSIHEENKWLLLLKLTGASVGFYISVFAGSRGGWLAFPFLVLIWASLQTTTNPKLSLQKKTAYTTLSVLIISLMIGCLFHYVPAFSDRVLSGYREISDWLSGTNVDTSAGIRLSIWKLSLQLIQSNPWLGFGEIGIAQILEHSSKPILFSQIVIDTLTAAGPHSDILAKLLYTGIIGLIAYFATLFIPWMIFWKNRHHNNNDSRLAARMGLYLVTGIFFCGLSNEMLSLKYLCSFFGLMVACLIAQIYNKSKSI